MRRILGGTLDSEVFKELQLPMKTNPERSHIGIGLTSACDIAASAFLSQASGCNKLVEMALTGSTVKGVGQCCFAKDAYDALAQQCGEEDVVTFHAFEVKLAYLRNKNSQRHSFSKRKPKTYRKDLRAYESSVRI